MRKYWNAYIIFMAESKINMSTVFWSKPIKNLKMVASEH